MEETNEELQAVMTITVNQKLEVATHYRGHPGLMVGMLGGVRFAEEWCIGQLKAKENPLCVDEKSNHTLQVTKQEALQQYYEAMDKLRARLSAITLSSDSQTFDVPSFLHSL